MNRGAVRLGLIVPSSNTVMEPDLYRNLPSYITLHTARMHLKDATAEGERAMIEHVQRAAVDLGTLSPDLVVFGCTSAGALIGAEGEARLKDLVRLASGAPVLTVVAAVQAVLRVRGWNRIAVLTPYVEELNEPIRRSVEAVGVEVSVIRGLGLRGNLDIGRVEPAEIVQWAIEELSGVLVDGVFLSCTNLQAVAALEATGRNLGLPCISSNSCVIEVVTERFIPKGRGDCSGRETTMGRV